jgi:hypothetical protein
MDRIFQLVGIPSSILIVFAAIVAVSEGLERSSSAQAKKDFANYLRSTDFSALSVRLPKAIEELFERLFGKHHFSALCIFRSATFSLAAIVFLLTLGFLTHYSYFRTMPAFIAEHPGFRVKYFGYITWSLVPDYFNLYKTRLIIHWTTRHNLPIVLLIAILLLDVGVSYLVFASLYFFFECLNMGYQLVALGAINVWRLPSTVLWIFKINILNELITNPSTLGMIIRGPADNEVAVLFYAGLLPSIWLWLYTAATMVTRIASRAKGLITGVIYFLDVEKHPIRSVGLVAGVIASSILALSLAVKSWFY